MTTTRTEAATGAETILAIDLGKYKRVAYVHRAADDQRFLTFTTRGGARPGAGPPGRRTSRAPPWR